MYNFTTLANLEDLLVRNWFLDKDDTKYLILMSPESYEKFNNEIISAYYVIGNDKQNRTFKEGTVSGISFKIIIIPEDEE